VLNFCFFYFFQSNFGISCSAKDTTNEESDDSNEDEDNESNSRNEITDVSQIYENSYTSVVGIGILDNNLDSNEEAVIGSGFVISTDGYIATNQHVVSFEDETYFVKFPDSEEIQTVTEIFRDRGNDIAILKIEATELDALPIGDSNDLTPGEVVVAIGNPLGDLSSSITSGIISGLGRTVEIGSGSFLRTEISRFEDTIQTDAAINPGNSGGPLLNSKGEVIGINFSTVADANNLSFAIPISYLEHRLEELKEFGKFRIAYVGLSYSTNSFILDGEILYGAEILSVDPNGGAAGILKEGDVVTQFGETSLEEDSLFRLIQSREIGEEVEVEFIRGREVLTATVKIIEQE